MFSKLAFGGFADGVEFSGALRPEATPFLPSEWAEIL